MLEECGVPYRLAETDFATGATRTPEFLAVNPNGHVPVLRDGELVLFESLAINLHLAQRYAQDLWPHDIDDQSRLYQWCAWAMGELEGPHDAANKVGAPVAQVQVQAALAALATRLQDRDFLLGPQFTVADLNVAAVLMRPSYQKQAAAHEVIGGWFRRCAKREALQRAVTGG